MVLVKSKQPSLRARHFSKPVYDYIFETEPVEMPLEHAEHLCASNSKFEIVKGKKKKEGD